MPLLALLLCILGNGGLEKSPDTGSEQPQCCGGASEQGLGGAGEVQDSAE